MIYASNPSKIRTQNEFFMSRCLDLARMGCYYVAPNPMVGAVLVSADGEILGEGYHMRYGGPHAEVNCFRDAEANGYTDFSDATIYVSLEPCSHFGKTPPCANLLVEKGVKRCVIGTLDPNPQVSGRGVQILRSAGIKVEVGVLEAECRDLNRRFLMLQEHKRPYIILKWAQTSDGYIDARGDTEHPLVISNPLTKQIVHRMRAENMAILVGKNTALLDNPGLRTTRWNGRNPIRILLDHHRSVPASARMFQPDPVPNDPLYPQGEYIVLHEHADWAEAVRDLGTRGIHSVLVEGGVTVLNSILASGLYDEVHVEVSPAMVSPAALSTAVPAPKIALPAEPYETVEGHLLYAWRKA